MASSVKRFEDLDAWKLSKSLAGKIYSISRKEPLSKDYGFADQLRRASVSVMNNFAEGFERSSNKDFSKFVFYAKGSAGEVRSMLYLAREMDYITEAEFNDLYSDCVRVSQMSWGLLKRLGDKGDWKTKVATTA